MNNIYYIIILILFPVFSSSGYCLHSPMISNLTIVSENFTRSIKSIEENSSTFTLMFEKYKVNPIEDILYKYTFNNYNKIEKIEYISKSKSRVINIINFNYNDKGLIKEITQYNEFGSVINKSIFEYDGKTEINLEKYYFSKGDLFYVNYPIWNNSVLEIIKVVINKLKIEKTYKISCNTHKNIELIEEYNNKGVLIPKYKYEYTYDDIGNWIERRGYEWTDEFGKQFFEPKTIYYRKIEYMEIQDFEQGNTKHLVRDGETVDDILKTYNLTFEQLTLENDIYIKPNTSLIIPKITKTQETPILNSNNLKDSSKVNEDIEYIRYLIQKGDTIKKIASYTEVDYELLKRINNLSDDSKLIEGKVILLPKDAKNLEIPPLTIKEELINEKVRPYISNSDLESSQRILNQTILPILTPGSKITKEKYDQFWNQIEQLCKEKNIKDESKDLFIIEIRNVFTSSIITQKLFWTSAKSSLKAHQVVEEPELYNQLERFSDELNMNQLKSYYKDLLSKISKEQPINYKGANLLVDNKLIDEIVNGIDGSSKRAEVLFNSAWDAKLADEANMK